MARLLVAADLHLGAGATYGRTPGARLQDQADVWAETCRLAFQLDVDGFLFAGDLFDRAKPSPAEYVAAIRGLRLLHEAKIPALIIAGNHDCAGTDESSPLDVLSAYATIVKAPRVVDVAGVPIACLPWTSPARFAAATGNGDRDETHAAMAERLVETAAGLRADGAEILLAHWSLSGAVSASGQSTDSFREIVLPRRELEAQGWDGIVAGHLHKRQGLGSFGFYPGSLAVCDFSEAEQPHGFAVVDVGRPELAPQWVEVEQRPFVTVDVGSMDEPDAFLNDARHWLTDWFDDCGASVTDAVVRFRYQATEDEARRVDHRAISDALYAAGAHKVYAIEAQIDRPTRVRVESASTALSPAEALDLWLDHQEVPAERGESMRVAAGEYEEALR
jgi:exonuclease SbcD